ncbi:MAG: hypothetical protein WCK53_07120 [Methanomicrobiales archaeon]
MLIPAKYADHISGLLDIKVELRKTVIHVHAPEVVKHDLGDG